MDGQKSNEGIADEEAFRLRLQAIEAGVTAEVRARLLEFARRRERMLRSVGARCAVGDAAEFVHDAIADTLIGAVTWAPGVPVEVHLHGVIQSRTAWAADRERKAPHVSIDDTIDQDEVGDELATLGSDPGPEGAYAAREALDLVMGWLEACDADATVLRLIAAYRIGARTPAQVARVSSLTLAEVGAARRRLDRLTARMPVEVRGDDLSQSGSSW